MRARTTLRLTALAALTFFVTSALRADPPGKPADGEITKLLPGEWATAPADTGPGDPKGTIKYTADGTYVAAGKVRVPESGDIEVRVEGTWVVTDGAVVLKVTKSSRPALAPVGAELKEHVLAIDGKELRVRRGTGKERVRKRLAE